MTLIEWTDESLNPIRADALKKMPDGSYKRVTGWHCTKPSEGCRNCYAEMMNGWRGTGLPYKPSLAVICVDGPPRTENMEPGKAYVYLHEKTLLKPLGWRKPKKIFVCDMNDLFLDGHPDIWIDRIFAVMALCPQHTFQVLTKRPKRMRAYLEGNFCYEHIYDAMDLVGGRSDLGRFPFRTAFPNGMPWPLPNVWLGVSAEDQKTADLRIPHLLDTPAIIRFVSYEPALGPVDFKRLVNAYFKAPEDGAELIPMNRPRATDAPAAGYINALSGQVWGRIEYNEKFGFTGTVFPALDWVICGGESGTNARPMHPDWARSARDQCAAAGVKFFFKQWGKWLPGENWGPEKAGDPWPLAKWQDGETGQHSAARDNGGPGWMHFGTVGEPGAFALGVGKKAAGRLLDGHTHDEYPDAQRALRVLDSIEGEVG